MNSAGIQKLFTAVLVKLETREEGNQIPLSHIQSLNVLNLCAVHSVIMEGMLSYNHLLQCCQISKNDSTDLFLMWKDV